jgi:hypothetical protein
MAALENLTAAFNNIHVTVGAAVERIQYLAHDLAYARAEAADSAAVEKMASDLNAVAEQLRAALAAIDQPHA